MSGRNLFASLLLGLGGLALTANAALAWQPFPKPGEGDRNNVIEIKYRARGPLFYLPIAPSYLAYDYPYYYSRGHYPKHIGPGYVYYGYRLTTTAGAPLGTGYASPIGAMEKKTIRTRNSQR